MRSLLAPVMACHHWISVCAEALPATAQSKPAASQLQPNSLFIRAPPDATATFAPLFGDRWWLAFLHDKAATSAAPPRNLAHRPPRLEGRRGRLDRVARRGAPGAPQAQAAEVRGARRSGARLRSSIGPHPAA